MRFGPGFRRVEGSKEMNSAEYLARIGVDEVSLDEAGLRRLQRRHLLTVPFENLDIHWDRKIVLDIDAIYRKVVGEKRGGFCYELNGLFGALLNELGFQTRMASARVATGDGNFSREYDHMALVAAVGNEEFLVDVGFGAFTTEPLRMVIKEEQEDPSGMYVIREHEDGYLIVLKENVPEYIFKPVGRELAEFEGMCEFHQTSSDSHFTQRKVCSLLTENGRKTLTDNRFIVTTGGEKKESEVASEEEFGEILEREFGITH